MTPPSYRFSIDDGTGAVSLVLDPTYITPERQALIDDLLAAFSTLVAAYNTETPNLEVRRMTDSLSRR